MRPSKKKSILEAALRVAGNDARGVTIETVAKEAGITKAGVLYHFSCKHDLVLAIQQYIADDWEARLRKAAGGPPEELTARERLVAYTKVAGTIGKAELVMLIEATSDPTLMAPVDTMIQRWVPGPQDAVTDPAALDLYLIRMASDGLWLYESLNPMTVKLRQRLSKRLEHLITLLDEPQRD